MHTSVKAKPRPTGLSRMARLPLAAAIYFAIGSTAFAQDAERVPPADATNGETTALETVTVTAQKRTENLQEVPINIQVLGTEQLESLNISDFDDYVKYLPSVSYQSAGPGFAQIYMRGVASGGDGNHSGSLPSVGVYLDEQPITTIQGPLDIHVYDIERVEALSGPQGTLYGASSQAGTLRIIANKPDPSAFAAGYGTEVNTVSHGGVGYVGEGFLNQPLSESAAIRLVGWHKRDAGYIDNVLGTRTFPTWDDDSGGNGTITNAARAEDDYNEVETTGARLALKLDLNDSWTISPTVMGQRQTSNGSFAFDPNVGELALTHFYPERAEDRWTQAALTVEGKIGNFDLTYAFAHLKRDVDVESDYSDYSFWYDTLFGYGSYLCSDVDAQGACVPGTVVNPSQYIQGIDGYKKTSHELRIASPQDERFRFVAGVFLQDQKHDIEQRYLIDGDLADELSVTGWPDTIWLTQQDRRDKDSAVFGELSFDFTDKLTATLGARFFRVNNTLKGFFGFSDGISGSTGEAACISEEDYEGAPCLSFDKRVKEDGNIGRFNLTYQINEDVMLYGTWSEGYRPGGLNRRGTLPPYLSDFLTNYEVGLKSAWLDNSVIFNAALFRQEWEDFQFSILGANGLTEIKNANQARINGLEMDLTWAATYNLQISGGVSLYNAELTANYCGETDTNGVPITDCAAEDLQAASGTRLPVTPKFKGNLLARYTADVGNYQIFGQGVAVHTGNRTSDLRTAENGILGNLDAYTTVDLSAGLGKDSWKLELYVNNVFDELAEVSKFTQCAEAVCGAAGEVDEYPNGQVYTITNQPRTLGIRFSQEF
ncbi:MAG: TonB-dependent receptor [Pseudomonadota bacterium]|nr:TonB-dependent receptor [Pseudomonadota bacterium]